MSQSWNFTDALGSFTLPQADGTTGLYFPLANEHGMMSAITPRLHGDAKAGQNSFLLPPVSEIDLHNTRSGRNFWVSIEGYGPWSVAGTGPSREEAVTVDAGFLWHSVTRENPGLGLRAETLSFVPVDDGRLEAMRVTLTNIGDAPLTLTPTTAIPLYARSADNLRDHRHVTALLNRARTLADGVEVCPTMTFDERGHKPNTLRYTVLAREETGAPPFGAIPRLEDFIGEGGSLDCPRAVFEGLATLSKEGDTASGCEVMGALRFAAATLERGESRAYLLVLGISETPLSDEVRARLLTPHGFESRLSECRDYWHARLDGLSFESADQDFDRWMRWVALQPMLRRIYGCSFLPHHDYGKGGRGWRDLWQDSLALMLMDAESVRPALLNHFGGVRLDGTNATIIGARPGEFIADRNSISRVWSDHGVWPLFTTALYLDQSGDLAFLLERQVYFKDRLAMRATTADEAWTPDYGSRQRTESGEVYAAGILEHLLIQALTAFFNAGKHGSIRIENADWNDALDMAAEEGETVAFTAFYAANLKLLARLCLRLSRELAVGTIPVAEELLLLLDRYTGDAVDYAEPPARRARLREYCARVVHTVSGKTVSVNLEQLAEDLAAKGEHLAAHIREHEFLEEGWFNGYYDNNGARLEGRRRMTLTGQVFPIMMDVADDDQVRKTVEAVERRLFDETIGSYRLNTDFDELLLTMGRCFGFAYGEKENGAVFSHMVAMYASALYHRGLAEEGWRALQSLYRLSTRFETARIYPGIPEYFGQGGRGKYHYLTGSASWYLLVMLTQSYGIHGQAGDLCLSPKLLAEQFDEHGDAAVHTVFAGRKLRVVYHNPERLDRYAIDRVTLDGVSVSSPIPRERLETLSKDALHTISVDLGVPT